MRIDVIARYYKDEDWKRIPEDVRQTTAFAGYSNYNRDRLWNFARKKKGMEGAKHAHTCPDCGKWTTGTGETLCPDCAKQNTLAARKYVQARLRENPGLLKPWL